MKKKLIIEKKNFITEDDSDFIWRLMPDWIRFPIPENNHPTFYGTGSYESDVNLVKKVRNILFNEKK